MKTVKINGLNWDCENTVVNGEELFTHKQCLSIAKEKGKRLPTDEEWMSLADLGSTWDEEKKKRWNKVMSMDKSMARRWNDSSECRGCFHLEKDSWCNYNDLPCTVNPILTFRMGMTGMACYGLGRVEREPELFDNESKFKL